MPIKGEDLIRRALGKDYVELKIQHLVIEDNLQGVCSVKVSLPDGKVSVGDGAGQIDALFSALKRHYGEEFKSLGGIKLSNFDIRLGRGAYCEDSEGVTYSVTLDITNSRGLVFEFKHTSQSLTMSLVCATVATIGFFINSEKAFCLLRRALRDAEERNRQDLVSRYLYEISVVSENASYVMIPPEK